MVGKDITESPDNDTLDDGGMCVGSLGGCGPKLFVCVCTYDIILFDRMQSLL